MKKAQIIILLLVLLTFCSGCAGQGNQSNTETEVATEAITWQSKYDIGMRLLSTGNFEDAIIAFEAAIELDDSKPEAYVRRGDAIILSAETSDNLTLALNDYQSALTLDDSNVKAHLGIADVYIRQGDYKKAVATLEDALNKTSQNHTIKSKLSEIESGVFTDSSNNPRLELHYYGNERKLVGYIEFDYNENGELYSASGYTADGTPAGYVEPKTTVNGDTTEEIMYSWYQQEDIVFYVTKQIWTKTIHPDGSYDIIETYFWEGDEINYYLHKRYDPNHRCVLTENYDIDGTFSNKITYEYDTQGNCIRTNYYDKHGSLSSYILEEYNEKGQNIKDATYSGNGELQRYSLAKFGEHGKITGVEYYNKSGELTSYSIKQYDKNGNLIVDEQYDNKGNLTFSRAIE